MRGPYSLSGSFVQIDGGEGLYYLSVMHGETQVRVRLATDNAVTAGAAGYLLDHANDPEALALEWLGVPPGGEFMGTVNGEIDPELGVQLQEEMEHCQRVTMAAR
jgi:hypothetical protein